MATPTPIAFNISDLSIESTSLAASFGTTANTFSNYHAVATIVVDVQEMENIFRFRTDGFDVTNIVTEDTHYQFVYPLETDPAWVPLGGVTNSLSNAFVQPTGGDPTLDNINQMDPNITISSIKNTVGYDYPRLLGKVLFNTIRAVDLLGNEAELVAHLITAYAEAHKAVIGSFSRDVENSSANSISQMFLEQLTSTSAGSSRLANLNSLAIPFADAAEEATYVAAQAVAAAAGNGTLPRWYGIPLAYQDEINFIFTVKAATDQQLLTMPDSTTQVEDHRYLIKLVMGDSSRT